MVRRIMVPLDGSRYADHALPHAVGIALRTGALLELVHVYPRHFDIDRAVRRQRSWPETEVIPEADSDGMRLERELLEEKAAQIELRYDVNVRTRLLRGHAATALTREASEIVADLIVLATHAREGINRIFFGDVAHELIEQLNVPAWCVRPANDAASLVAPEPKHMLITLDGSTFSEQILDVALPLVQALDANATLLNVVTVRSVESRANGKAANRSFTTRNESQQYLDDVAHRYHNMLPNLATCSVTGIDTAAAIGQVLERGQYDVVAMATHGRSGLSRLLLGSVADKVLRRSARTVLLYRPRALRLPEDRLEDAFRIYGN